MGQDEREHDGHSRKQQHARERIGKVISQQPAPFSFAPCLIGKKCCDRRQWRDAAGQKGRYPRWNNTCYGLRQRAPVHDPSDRSCPAADGTGYFSGGGESFRDQLCGLFIKIGE